MKDKSLYWLWLTDNVKSYVSIFRLLEHFGNIDNIYNASYSDLLRACDKEVANALRDKSLEKAEKIIENTVKSGAYVLTYDSPDYPELLRHIYDPPYVLYLKGTLFDWNSFIGIGVVGTRNCDNYGISVTDALARELAINDFMVISGLARGIDSVAAKAAIEEGKPTIGVLGCAINKVYPIENVGLYEQVENNGLIISEYAPDETGPKSTFARRNRIISGLSRGVLITQAPEKSGALITAKFALEQGRDVFSVPGPITEKRSSGTNRLICDGAIPVTGIHDIIKEYPEIAAKKPEVIRKHNNSSEPIKEKIDISGFTGIQQIIVKCISDGKNHIDEIVKEVGMTSSFTANELLILEIMGIVVSTPGNRYELKGKI